MIITKSNATVLYEQTIVINVIDISIKIIRCFNSFKILISNISVIAFCLFFLDACLKFRSLFNCLITYQTRFSCLCLHGYTVLHFYVLTEMVILLPLNWFCISVVWHWELRLFQFDLDWTSAILFSKGVCSRYSIWSFKLL